jgi:hypothetical protein
VTRYAYNVITSNTDEAVGEEGAVESQFDVTLHIRAPRDLRAGLDRIARRRLLTRTDIVREALMQYLRAQGELPAMEVANG